MGQPLNIWRCDRRSRAELDDVTGRLLVDVFLGGQPAFDLLPEIANRAISATSERDRTNACLPQPAANRLSVRIQCGRERLKADGQWPRSGDERRMVCPVTNHRPIVGHDPSDRMTPMERHAGFLS